MTMLSESGKEGCGRFLEVSLAALILIYPRSLTKLIGNFYSIENDYDIPARIFFSQGCEVVETTEAY
jgi:hypothetical protein